MTQRKLYAIGHPKGYVKLGVSKSPKDRCADLQSGSPYELWVITEIEQTHDTEALPDERPSFETVENAVHKYYYQCTVKREWFDIPENERHALGRIQSISLSDMWDVIYEQEARSWSKDRFDEYAPLGNRGTTLEYHLEAARKSDRPDVIA